MTKSTGKRPPYKKVRTLTERLWAKIERTPSGCWEWTAARDPSGYGRVADGNNVVKLAHRVVYELIVEPIPDGLHIDHLCRNPSCVNPSHLEPVTQYENFIRGRAPEIAPAFQRNKTHCPQGHPYDEENTYRPPLRPNARACKECKRRQVRESRARARG